MVIVPVGGGKMNDRNQIPRQNFSSLLNIACRHRVLCLTALSYGPRRSMGVVVLSASTSSQEWTYGKWKLRIPKLGKRASGVLTRLNTSFVFPSLSLMTPSDRHPFQRNHNTTSLCRMLSPCSGKTARRLQPSTSTSQSRVTHLSRPHFPTTLQVPLFSSAPATSAGWGVPSLRRGMHAARGPEQIPLPLFLLVRLFTGWVLLVTVWLRPNLGKGNGVISDAINADGSRTVTLS